MADINAILHQIASAIYGADVRQSIYDAIDFIHNEYLTIKTVADQMDELIALYESYVAQAKELTGKLDEKITTGTSLKEDLTDLDATLSDGRQVLAELKTENGKATTNIEEAQEKIEIIQGLLEQFPDLDSASQVATQLEEAYNQVKDQLTNLDEIKQLLSEIDADTQIINENKEALGAVAQNIDIIKQFIEMGGVDLGDFEIRLSKIEQTLSGLEETLENLI